jgi:hypothetical protein
MAIDRVHEFENRAGTPPMDETDRSLRAYVARIPEHKLAQYDPSWSDEQVMAWDGNFRSDGELMLVCCERDVDVAEFRRVVEEYLAFSRQSG